LEKIFTRYKVLKGQGKATVVPIQAMKAHKGRRGIVPLDSTEWSISCPSHINPEKEPQYMLNRELDGPPEPVWMVMDWRDILALSGI